MAGGYHNDDGSSLPILEKIHAWHFMAFHGISLKRAGA